VQAQDHKIILTGSAPIVQTPTPANPITTLLHHQFVCTWQWETHIISNLPQLITDIQSGKGYAVSDGSFQARKVTAAWIFKGPEYMNCIVGMGLNPSNDKGHSSFHRELAIIYAIMFTLQMLLPKIAT